MTERISIFSKRVRNVTALCTGLSYPGFVLLVYELQRWLDWLPSLRPLDSITSQMLWLFLLSGVVTGLTAIALLIKATRIRIGGAVVVMSLSTMGGLLQSPGVTGVREATLFLTCFLLPSVVGLLLLLSSFLLRFRDGV